MSMLGFSCTIMCTWEGVLLYLHPFTNLDNILTVSRLFLVSFANGGYAGSIYGFLIVWLGNLAVFSTMGELASMYVSFTGPRNFTYT
jgi:choline transport protein